MVINIQKKPFKSTIRSAPKSNKLVVLMHAAFNNVLLKRFLMSRIKKPPMILSNIAKNFTKNFTKNFANKEGTVTVVVVDSRMFEVPKKDDSLLVGNGLNFQPICSPCPPTGTNSVLLRGKKSLREGCLRSSERLQVFHRDVEIPEISEFYASFSSYD
ncbi:hypothetical protein H8356DRAFT_1421082 [Neocallimastix lanati (nom. inval.)]|nr:hypothetical protein H8356DRAFT_1421082 [Neocallimastix sp. JGI-2020a]